MIQPKSWCNCPNLWCFLDSLTLCKVRWICDRHEFLMTGLRS